MKKLLLCFICFSLLFTEYGWAQLSNRNKTTKDVLFTANFHYGKSLQHSSKFNPEIRNNAIGAEFNVGVNVSGRHHWHKRFNYPEIGGSLVYLDFGNNTILGRGIGLSPYISFPVINKEIYKLQIRLGAGIGFLTKTYDILDNSINNVIGSKINGTGQFKILNNIKLNDKWRLLAGVALTHFSNGNVQKPNLGINTVSGNIGIQYLPNNNPQRLQPDTSKNYFKRFHGVVKIGIAINEGPVPGAAKYPIYIAMATLAKHTGRHNKLQLGAEYEFRSDQYVLIQSSIDRQGPVSRMDVSRFAVFFGDEIVFKNFALSMNVGVYVNKFEGKPFYFYNKNGIIYYVPLQKHKPSLFMGIFLKTHYAIADYFEYGIGYIF